MRLPAVEQARRHPARPRRVATQQTVLAEATRVTGPGDRIGRRLRCFGILVAVCATILCVSGHARQERIEGRRIEAQRRQVEAIIADAGEFGGQQRLVPARS
jgi:hypothetical protein